VKPFNAKNGTLYHGDVEAVTRDRIPGILQACHDNPATGRHFGRFPHSSLWASQLMRASIWITARVTTTTLFWVFSDIWWT